MVHIQAIGFDILEDCIVYHFNILFDKQNWIISKTYDDFVSLHEEMEDVYGTEQVPYLTGDVRPWARLKHSTGARRLPKLESYLCEAAATDFYPRVYNVSVPLVNDPTATKIIVNKFLFDFLNFAEHYSYDGPVDADGKSSISVVLSEEQTITGNVVEGEVVLVDGKVVPTTVDNNNNNNNNNNTIYAEVSLSQEDEETQRRKYEIMKLEEYTKESKKAIQRSEAVHCPTVTNQIKIFIESFTLPTKERDYEEYDVMVIVWGVTWNLTKKYSDFTAIHTEMTDFYGVSCVPAIDKTKIPFYKKVDEVTAKMRQDVFNEFFEIILRNIDDWEPKGYLVEYSIDDVEDTNPDSIIAPDDDKCKKKGKYIVVMFNKFIFEFFRFQENLTRVDVSAVHHAVQMQTQELPEALKQAMKQQQEAVTRLKVIKELHNRMQFRKLVSDQDINDLITYTRQVQEDRDLLNVIQHFCLTGKICRDINYLAKKYEVQTKDDFTAQLRNIAKDCKSELDHEAEEEQKEKLHEKSKHENSKKDPHDDGPIIVRRAKNEKEKVKAANRNKQNALFKSSDVSYSMMSTAIFDNYDVMEDSNSFVTLSGHTEDPTIDTTNSDNYKELSPARTHYYCYDSQTCTSHFGHSGSHDSGPNENTDDAVVGDNNNNNNNNSIIALTSNQAAIIAESIYFNDTRVLAIKLMSMSLCDDTHFDELFNTLIYYWEETKAEVIKRISSAND